MKQVQVFYAVKSNTDPLLLKLLAGLGTNFDCASQAEIELVRYFLLISMNIKFYDTSYIKSLTLESVHIAIKVKKKKLFEFSQISLIFKFLNFRC